MNSRFVGIFLIASILLVLAGGALSAMPSCCVVCDTTLVHPVDSVAFRDSVRRREALESMRGYTIYTDSNTWKKDTTKVDTMPKSKSSLDAPVSYTAKDSITFDLLYNRANLFGNSHVGYQNLELTADVITIALDSSIVHAEGRKDSIGEVIGKPLFRQGSEEYEPDRISYNFKTRRAFITNVYTKQGEGFMTTDESKRDSSGLMYLNGGKYTTCDAQHPHFYLKMSRAKVRPGKSVVFGPAHLVVEDVPLPLAVPYGFFPFSHSYQSGFIMPSYGDETERGFYLREGGYYFAINDYVDLKLVGDIYTKGSWGLSLSSNYKKRYKFSGSLYLSFQKTVFEDKSQPSVSDFKITWTHRQDSKANPSSSFSASVNYASTSYEKNNLTSRYNPESYTQSTRTSSVSYSKTFEDLGLTLSGTFNLSQNLRDSMISVTLPTLNITLARLYPFKRKHAVGKERWYEKIAMSYTGTLQNSITTKDYKLFKSNLLKDWRNGMKHQIPISATVQLFKYINLTTSFNFTDRMYMQKVRQDWDKDKQTVVRDTTLGFYNVYDYNLSLSLNTKLYGFYKPAKWAGGKFIQAIRHVFTPSVSFSYAPDFGSDSYGYYGSYQRTDRDGVPVGNPVTYSYYAGSLYGTPSAGMRGNINMDVSNNLEMKVASKSDSTGMKKVSLIDELGASLSYNMAAKSRPWSDLSTRLRLKLSKNYTFSLNAVFATYAYEFDERGNVVVGDRTEWSYGRFGRFQGMSQNFSYTFNNETFKKIRNKLLGLDTAKDDNDEEDEEDDDFTDPEMQNVDPDREKGKTGAKKNEKGTQLDEDGYLKFQMPWSFTVSYGVIMRENTSAKINPKNMRYPYKFTHTLNFSGNVRISEGWNITFSSGYDFNYNRLSMTTASLSRDLHCFSMSCSMVLMPYRSFNFNFQAEASALRDVLRWRKQSSYSSNIEWY
ncbi:MAG: LPS-assembly protein LptD [Bacteroidaceae bacterium]|nr:LPS-assembly protein LptD [Bacteroidaceae bacterium]